MKRSCISSGWFLSFAFSNINIGGRSTCSSFSIIVCGLPSAIASSVFQYSMCALMCSSRLNSLAKWKRLQRTYHRPASDHIGQARVDLRMVGQRQRRISRVPRSKRTQHDLMTAAGIAERSYAGRSVELPRMRFEPANSEVDIADRSGITRLRRVMEIERGDQDTLGRQRSVDAGIIGPIAVVPRAAMHVDDGRKWSGSLGLINASEPRLACLVLILDIPLVYFVFIIVDHGGNLQPRRVSLQVQQTAV